MAHQSLQFLETGLLASHGFPPNVKPQLSPDIGNRLKSRPKVREGYSTEPLSFRNREPMRTLTKNLYYCRTSTVRPSSCCLGFTSKALSHGSTATAPVVEPSRNLRHVVPPALIYRHVPGTLLNFCHIVRAPKAYIYAVIAGDGTSTRGHRVPTSCTRNLAGKGFRVLKPLLSSRALVAVPSCKI